MKRARSKGGYAGPDGTKSVFGQMASKLTSFGPDSLMLPHRVWKVKFVGQYYCVLSYYHCEDFHIQVYFLKYTRM